MTSAARVTLVLGLLLLSTASLRAEESHVRAQLVCPGGAVAPGSVVALNVVFDIDPHWHIYWRNPGDAGTATEIAWTLPEGYAIDSIAWPLPHMLGEPPEVSYGYENRVVLTAFLRVPQTVKPGETVEIGARVDWLVCNEICIPGRDTLHLQLPARAQVGMPGTLSGIYDAPPGPLGSSDEVRATASESSYTLHVNARWVQGAASIEFYPYEEATIDHSAPQEMVRASTEATLTLRRSPFATSTATRLRGVLVWTIPSSASSPARVGAEIDVPVQ